MRPGFLRTSHEQRRRSSATAEVPITPRHSSLDLGTITRRLSGGTHNDSLGHMTCGKSSPQPVRRVSIAGTHIDCPRHTLRPFVRINTRNMEVKSSKVLVIIAIMLTVILLVIVLSYLLRNQDFTA